MQELYQIVEKSLKKVISELVPEDAQLTQEQMKTLLTPMLQNATNPKFGHYQINNSMNTFKICKTFKSDMSQIEISQKICAAVLDNKGDVVESVTVAAVFVNITLTDSYLVRRALSKFLVNPEQLPTAPVYPKQKIAVDFSSPNVAKEMHVGHLRSTIIGDTICRLLEYLGMEVLRINHIGDWGTQFGMLIAFLMRKNMVDTAKELPISDLVAFYKEAKALFDADKDFATEAHQEVVKLQGGGELEIALWKKLCDISRKAFQEIYDLLDIKITDFGESFYNPFLQSTVDDLTELKLAEISQGATIIRIENVNHPLMIKKTDGGFTYDTTDMAAIRYRCKTLEANRLIYVTDLGQELHFKMIFDAANRAGWNNGVKCEHVGFGVVLGADGKKFKTRAGTTEKLIDLLKEAQQKAEEVVRAGRENYTDEEIKQIAMAVGIGAVKYADLCSQRTRDYVFSYDKMLNFKGNTASYMLYSFARISSIVRNITTETGSKGIDRNLLYTEEFKISVKVTSPEERSLLVVLLKMDDIIDQTFIDLMPHHICDWMYSISQAFTLFYEKCRVMEGDTYSKSRLVLCEITRQALRFCFNVLGIREVEKM